MALSERHWILGTLLACGAIAAMKLPPEPRPRADRRLSSVTIEARVRDRLQGHLRREVATLALLERRDSLMRRLARMPAHDTLRVLYDRDVPPSVREALGDAIAREVAGVGGRMTALPVAVRVLADTGAHVGSPGTGYSEAAWLEAEYVLPPATDGRTCIAIVRVGERVLEDVASPSGWRILERALDRGAGRLLGPCAFYGAHGPPGPEIERWLTMARSAFALRAPAPGSDSIRNPFRGIALGDNPLLRSASWSIDRTYLHPDMVRCAEREHAGCEAALVSPRSRQIGRFPWLLDDDGPRTIFGHALGPAEPWLLASLHERVGAEAFGDFWRSPLAPDGAFRGVTGITLSDATRDWVRETYGAAPRRTWPHPFALAGQVLLVGGLVGTAALRRRA